ncbi:MAG: GSCFA domain-containing protein [Culturomica sp.]|jgi:hypothetical protein|nr:GSCFA domain-containing protein [Culturomica sp.]
MNLQTKVEITAPSDKLRHSSQMLCIGSCFAENIGRKLQMHGFNVDINPFGIVYNPLSAANVLKRLLSKQTFTEDELLYNNGMWVSLSHHGSFSSKDKQTCLENINTRMSSAVENLAKVNCLLFTFGTAWVYEYIPQSCIVGNCHKISAEHFNRYCLDVGTIVREYSRLINHLKAVNPALRIVFTVSPIRHLKDGAHANQLSKATLLLAIDKLCSLFPEHYYFPSYEIVMDELRDYRFYASDMLHLSETAVDYIWEVFKTNCITASEYELMNKVEKINRGLHHRPSDPTDEDYLSFREKLQREINSLKSLYPEVYIQSDTVL